MLLHHVQNAQNLNDKSTKSAIFLSKLSKRHYCATDNYNNNAHICQADLNVYETTFFLKK